MEDCGWFVNQQILILQDSERRLLRQLTIAREILKDSVGTVWPVPEVNSFQLVQTIVMAPSGTLIVERHIVLEALVTNYVGNLH